MAVTTVSDLNGLFNTIYERALFVAREMNLMAGLVDNRSATGWMNRVVPIRPAITAVSVTETQDFNAPTTFGKSTKATITPGEVIAQVVLTDRDLETDPDNAQMDAERELLALNGRGVDGLSQMSAEWPTLAPILKAHKAAVLALESETLQQGQIVCGVTLLPDGSATWHPATEAPPQRAEGRHWRLLMKLIHAAGYALPPIRFSVDLDRALDAMGRYEGLAAATREAGYEVPVLPSDELISWVAWGIKAGVSHAALEEYVSERVVALGGVPPQLDVVRLWVLTSNADLHEIAGWLRIRQLSLAARLAPLQPAAALQSAFALASKPLTRRCDYGGDGVCRRCGSDSLSSGSGICHATA